MWLRLRIKFSQQWEQWFVRDTRQTDVVQKEFNVWAVIISYNCKEVPINLIMKLRTQLLLVTLNPCTCYYVSESGYDRKLMIILWHICSKQELLRQQRQQFLGSAKTPVARQQILNKQHWIKWKAVFSKRSVR
jgi:hypothetical protein